MYHANATNLQTTYTKHCIIKIMDKKKIPFLIIDILREETDKERPISLRAIEDLLQEKYQMQIDRRTTRETVNMLISLYPDSVKEQRINPTNIKYYYQSEFTAMQMHIIFEQLAMNRTLSERETKKLFKKLSKYVPYTDRDMINKIYMKSHLFDNRIIKEEIDFETVVTNFNLIEKALKKKKQIKFNYCGYNLEKKLVQKEGDYQRTPVAITTENGFFYLIARMNEKTKELHYYRIDKIINMQVLDEKAWSKPSKDYNIRNYINKSGSAFSGKIKLYYLHCQMDMLSAVIDSFGKDVTIKPIEGSHLFEARITSGKETIKRFVLSNLGSVTVYKDDELSSEIAEAASEYQRMVKKYQSIAPKYAK
jgi:predicted DNA-binding transcriptional regulator YafY